MEICDLVFKVFDKCFNKIIVDRSCEGCPFKGVPCCEKLLSFMLFVVVKYPNVLEEFYNEME